MSSRFLFHDASSGLWDFGQSGGFRIRNFYASGNLTIDGFVTTGGAVQAGVHLRSLAGYFEVYAFNFATYGDGRMQSYYDAINTRWNINARDSVGTSVKLTVNINGTVDADGYTFPPTRIASSDVNTLDDYEEGTFTPFFYGATTAGAPTHNYQEGYYTKIGNRVFGSIRIALTALGGMAGQLRLGGFPFNLRSLERASLNFSYIGNMNLPANVPVLGLGANSGSAFWFYRQNAVGSPSQLNSATEITATMFVWCSFQYATDD